ncbi:hypothetical protein [Nocardioides panzhihuensis]|uniref:Uncharacterized protein n=1 Tax=Nocardioides panzhihuensis TaxID=860243 RepID=A0A7Z0IVM1_9ACTN|nr:hypothetical protein [Nocardioides panzhihuensis]NYI81231.1 hypothetical protein [Nocardioides panzhihuensis]
MLGTYGEHQEAAAAALHELLSHMSARRHSGRDSHDFGTDAQRRLLLQRREAVLDALSDRIRLWATPGTQPTTAARVKVSNLGHETLPLLMGVIEERGRLPREERQSPLDVLRPAAGEQSSPGESARVDEELELWRQAAIELAAANHVLTTGEQDWFYQPATLWPVLADTATAAEAVVVLDEGLRRSGLQATDPHSPGAARQDALTARLIAGHTVRVARWQTTSEAADTLRAQPFESVDDSLPTGPAGPKVRLVRGVHDIAPAMQQLSRLVAPIRLSSAAADQEPQMGVRLLRPLAASWIEALEHVERLAGPAGEGYQFDNHRDSLGKLYNAMRTMVDTDPKAAAAASRDVVAQQSEIVRGLAVVAKATSSDITLAAAEQRALIAAAHEVGHQVGRRANQEVDRPDTQLQGRGGFPLASSRGRGQAAGAARALTEIPRPPSVVEAARARQWEDAPRPPGRTARDGLRATLDTTPSPGTASGIPGGLAAESYAVKVSDQLHDALTPDQVAAYDRNAADRTRSGRRRRNSDKESERDQ